MKVLPPNSAGQRVTVGSKRWQLQSHTPNPIYSLDNTGTYVLSVLLGTAQQSAQRTSRNHIQALMQNSLVLVWDTQDFTGVLSHAYTPGKQI